MVPPVIAFRSFVAFAIPALDHSYAHFHFHLCLCLFWTEGEAGLPPSHQARLEWMDSRGFTVDSRATLCGDLTSMVKFVGEWDNTELRDAFPYLIDGVVVKVNAIAQQQALGANNRAPRWAVAYKFGASQAVTQLLDIVYQVGRSGKVTPVAELHPVHLMGSLISRATLHNAAYVEHLALKRVSRTNLQTRVRLRHSTDWYDNYSCARPGRYGDC